MKLIEQIAFNFLLKRGYQITMPKVYFSGSDYKAWGSATYWEPKEPITKSRKNNRVEKSSKKIYKVKRKTKIAHNKETQ